MKPRAVDHSPCCADTVVVELTRLIGSVPALDDRRKFCRLLANFVISKPCPFHDGAAKRNRILLVLAGKAELADCRSRLSQRIPAFPLRMEHLVQKLRESINVRFGRLDVLVNAAGFTKPVPHSDLDALSDELIDRMFVVNWRGQYTAARTFAPLLKASGDGLIVFISSIAAFTAVGSSIAYCAAKAGIDVMTKALARVLAPEVRVLAVSPGVVDRRRAAPHCFGRVPA